MTPPKVALVTASSAGLGAAIARSLAASNIRVVINYHSRPQKAAELLSSLPTPPSSPSPAHHSLQADVSQKADIIRLVEETVKVMGRLDIVVSNAGWTRMVDFMNLEENLEEEDWDRCWLVNVKAHLWLCAAARKYLEESEGCFVSTASAAGVVPSGSSLPYAVSKAAQIHLAKGLAKICAPKIRVNSVSPGVLMTEWGQKFSEEALEKSKDKTVLKRFATVEDVADQVKTLALSRSMTGVNVVIDSGFVL